MQGFVQTVTIWNCDKSKQTVYPYEDIWYRHIIKETAPNAKDAASWKVKTRDNKIVSGDSSDNLTYVLIADRPDYINSVDWVNAIGIDANYFTIQKGDIIALGEHFADEDIPPKTSIDIINKYAPYAFEIGEVKENNQAYKLPQSRYVKVVSV